MAVYLLTGKLGSGKSLAAVDRAIDYASMGRRVVANFHIDFGPVARRDSHLAGAYVEVIPDRPTAADLLALGRGGPNESEAGLLILDECATFLNARHWSGENREGLIDWFLHSRKLGWDVILICQAQSALDKQIREMICEYLVTLRRLDKLNLPVIKWFCKIKLPRVHVAVVRYGMAHTDPVADTWVFRGTSFYACYSTEWISSADATGSYCTLPPNLSKFRYEPEPSGWFHRPKPKPRTLTKPPHIAALMTLSPDERWAAARRMASNLRPSP